MFYDESKTTLGKKNCDCDMFQVSVRQLCKLLHREKQIMVIDSHAYVYSMLEDLSWDRDKGIINTATNKLVHN